MSSLLPRLHVVGTDSTSIKAGSYPDALTRMQLKQFPAQCLSGNLVTHRVDGIVRLRRVLEPGEWS